MSDTNTCENICNNMVAVVAFTALMPLHCVFPPADLYNNHSMIQYSQVLSSFLAESERDQFKEEKLEFGLTSFKWIHFIIYFLRILKV